MHDGMPYGRNQGQGHGHEPIQGSRIENLQSREVDRQSPTGLIFYFYEMMNLSIWGLQVQRLYVSAPVFLVCCCLLGPVCR